MLVSACWDQALLLDQKNHKNESAVEALRFEIQNLARFYDFLACN
jgi:hypothetical protein